MRIVVDIEANSLNNPTNIWLIVCKDIDTGELHVFKELTLREDEAQRFRVFANSVTLWVGHNFLGYDWPVITRLLSISVRDIELKSIDTLIVSKLKDFSRKGGHSIESYGEEFGMPKGKFNDFTKYSQEMEKYCVRDVEICAGIYAKWLPGIQLPGLLLEQRFQGVVNGLHNNGFAFNTSRAESLLAEVTKELETLDKEIENAFPPRLVLVKEIVPRATKFGTLHKSDFRWVKDGDLSEYSVGAAFCRCEWRPFNASSHKQIIEVLSKAGWAPTEKTKTHIETEREVSRLRPQNKEGWTLDITNQYSILVEKIEKLKTSGWKVNEANLNTLPAVAPLPARMLAKRILYESRRRTLTEWLGLVSPDTGRIHGSFSGIGAWTHRMAHQKPNTANIPNEFKTNGERALLGKELRSLWCAPKKRLLVGCDAEGIQLRIFAHYIDDPEFTEALVKGKKDDKSDPHSFNQRVLGQVCKTRQAAKRFLYALLLGAGIGKLAEVLECPREDAQGALDRLMARYQGFDYLKKSIIPADARRGFFSGIDGRRVPIPGDTDGQRKHLCMSGYLQNGEAIIIKTAGVAIAQAFEELAKGFDTGRAAPKAPFLVDIIHDEYQSEAPDDMRIALQVAQIKADAIRNAGEVYKLKCPMAGSYWNDDHKDYTIGKNWSFTH